MRKELINYGKRKQEPEPSAGTAETGTEKDTESAEAAEKRKIIYKPKCLHRKNAVRAVSVKAFYT